LASPRNRIISPVRVTWDAIFLDDLDLFLVADVLDALDVLLAAIALVSLVVVDVAEQPVNASALININARVNLAGNIGKDIIGTWEMRMNQLINI